MKPQDCLENCVWVGCGLCVELLSTATLSALCIISACPTEHSAQIANMYEDTKTFYVHVVQDN